MKKPDAIIPEKMRVGLFHCRGVSARRRFVFKLMKPRRFSRSPSAIV